MSVDLGRVGMHFKRNLMQFVAVHEQTYNDKTVAF